MTPGDPITALDGALLVHVRVDTPHVSWKAALDRIRTVRRCMAGVVAGPTLNHEDEGITWVRGHVSEKDETGRALLAYGALSAQERIGLKDGWQMSIYSIQIPLGKK